MVKGGMASEPIPPFTAFYHLLPPFSEQPPHARLQLARITQPRADSAVEVQERPGGRVLEVVGSGQVEELDQEFELATRARGEGPREAHIPGEQRIPFANR